MIHVVLVGIGGYGRNYISEMLERPPVDAHLDGICDPFVSASPYYEQIIKNAVPVFSSLDEYFDAQEKSGIHTDLTVISSPIQTHYVFMKTALQHGSNVLCEKPACMLFSQYDELEAIERERGLFVGVGFQKCYAKDVLSLKKDIASGMYGKPVLLKSLRLMRRGKSYYTRNSWAGKIGSGDDLVLDSPFNNACAHEFQTMLFLLGSDIDKSADVSDVEAKVYRANPEIENYDAIALKASVVSPVLPNISCPVYYYAAHCIEEKTVGPCNQYVFENAVVNFDGGYYAVDVKSGKMIKDYRTIDGGDRLQKFYDCIDSVKNNKTPVCRLHTGRSHLKAVLMAQKHNIMQIPKEQLKQFELENDSFYAAKNISKLFMQHYNSATLPRDREML